MTGPAGNSEFFSPHLYVSLGFASENIEGLRETKLAVSLANSLFPLLNCVRYKKNHSKVLTGRSVRSELHG